MNIFRSDNHPVTKFISGFTVLALCVVIFMLSAQPGSVSDVTSGQFVNVLPEYVSEFFSEHFNLDELHTYLLIDEIIRSIAHFSEFALLCVLSCFHLNLCIKKHYFIFAFLFTSVYSFSDEFHQIFVPGRSAQIKDIIIDCSGAAAGLLFCLLVRLIYRKLLLKYEKN